MSYKTLTKQIKAALNKPHLYNNEEYKILKDRYVAIQRLRQNLIKYEKSQKGFGYNYEPISQASVSDTGSGEDNGVCGESQQSEQSGESES